MYYDNEIKEMKKKLEELEDKYNKSYLPLNNTNEFFKQRHEQFIQEVNELIDENKNINFNLDDIKEAVIESREEVYNKLIAENDNLNDIKKLHHIKMIMNFKNMKL